jgi:hypothetical protein
LLDLSTDYVLTGIAPLAHDPRLEPILSSTDLESLLDELRCTRPERMSIYTHLRQFTHHRVTRSYIESAVAWLRNPTGATMEESAVTAASDADLKALRDEDEGDD